MRKFYLVLGTVLMIQFTGCNGNNNTNAQNNEAANTPKEEVLAMNNVPDTKAEHATIKLTKAQFLEKVWNYEENPQEFVYKGDKPALIDFYADWCGPCRMMAPLMEELAAEYKDQIYIYKIDTDVEKELSGNLGIQSLPTFLVIPMQDQPQMLSGARNKELFVEIIKTHMLKE